MTMTGQRLVGAKVLRPRDAATLVIVDRSGPAPRILMGRRRADLAFMPNKFVFPGGRVDASDSRAPSVDELPTHEIDKLMLAMLGRPSRRRARGLAFAAVRETLEETGIMIGRQQSVSNGLLTFLPQLTPLTFFARAITPPGRTRRYDTRFFSVDAGAISAQGHPRDDELSALDWYTLEQARALDLPGITRRVVSDVTVMIDQVASARRVGLPFYHMRYGTLRCDDLVAPNVCQSDCKP